MQFFQSALQLVILAAQLRPLDGFIPRQEFVVSRKGFQKKAFVPPSTTALKDLKTPHPPPTTPPLEDLEEGPQGLYFVHGEEEQGETKVSYDLRWADFAENSLRDELEMRGLSREGTKEELVKRLEEDDKLSPSLVQGRAAARQIKEWTVNFLTSEIQKGVSPKAIKGAAMTAAVVGAIAGKGIATAGISSVLAAYTAILPGGTSDAVRMLGTVAYDAADTAIGLMKKIDTNATVETLGEIAEGIKELSRDEAYAIDKAAESIIPVDEEMTGKKSPEDELVEFAKAVEIETEELLKKAQAEKPVEQKRSPEAIRRSEKTARKLMEARFQYEAIARAARLAEEKSQQAEAARLAEQAHKEEEARLAEQARVAEEEARRAEAEQARLAEEVERVKKEQEARAAQLLAEQARVEERLTEESGPADEAVRQRQLEEAEEEVLLADTVEEYEEEDEDVSDDSISDADWEASVRAAQESIDRTIAGFEAAVAEDEDEKVDWEAAEKLAESLTESPAQDEEDEMDLEALARAAREAVETFEKVQQVEEEEKLAQKEEWDSLMDTGDEMVTDSATAEADWSKLSVADLRRELSGRGLPSTGSKTVLVSRLSEAVGSEEDSEESELPSNGDMGSDSDLEALAKAAREAVDMFDEGEVEEEGDLYDGRFASEVEGFDDGVDEQATEILDDTESTEESMDWSQLTVAKLRVELKSRGLSTTGKKADLVALLEASDKGELDEESTGRDETENWSKMTVAQLRKELSSRGLSTQGRKVELVATLASLSASEGNVDDEDDEIDLEELGRAAREAVQRFDLDEEPSDEALWEIDAEVEEDLDADADDSLWDIEETVEKPDFSSMTVAQLKQELKSRGLAVSGKKADLIARLEQ